MAAAADKMDSFKEPLLDSSPNIFSEHPGTGQGGRPEPLKGQPRKLSKSATVDFEMLERVVLPEAPGQRPRMFDKSEAPEAPGPRQRTTLWGGSRPAKQVSDSSVPSKAPNLGAVLTVEDLAPHIPLKHPQQLCETPEGHILVADSAVDASPGCLAYVALDGSAQPPLVPFQAPLVGVTCALVLKEKKSHSLLLVHYEEPAPRIAIRQSNGKESISNALNFPYAAAMSVDHTAAYVTVRGPGRVQRIDPRKSNEKAKVVVFGEDYLKKPYGIAVTPKEEIVVADMGTKRVVVFEKNGKLKEGFCCPEHELKGPVGVCVDVLGRIYVADSLANCIVVFDGTTGVVVKRIPLKESPRGVLVTRTGDIVISFANGKWGDQRKGGLYIIRYVPVPAQVPEELLVNVSVEP